MLDMVWLLLTLSCCWYKLCPPAISAAVCFWKMNVRSSVTSGCEISLLSRFGYKITSCVWKSLRVFPLSASLWCLLVTWTRRWPWGRGWDITGGQSHDSHLSQSKQPAGEGSGAGWERWRTAGNISIIEFLLLYAGTIHLFFYLQCVHIKSDNNDT